MVNVDAKAIYSMIQEKHLALRCCLQQWSTPMVHLSMGYNHPEFEPPTGSRIARRKKEKYLHIVISTR
jgi:hypothetical protein